MEELFTGAFKALIQLGGGGWIVAGLFLIGVVYLYRENNRIRDRAEAIGERTVLALERVAASNQTFTTTLSGATKSQEDMARLLVEVARRVEENGARIVSDNAEFGRMLRQLCESDRLDDENFRRLLAAQSGVITHLQQLQIYLAGRGHGSPMLPPPPEGSA